jgi:hypothetical protein
LSFSFILCIVWSVTLFNLHFTFFCML